MIPKGCDINFMYKIWGIVFQESHTKHESCKDRMVGSWYSSANTGHKSAFLLQIQENIYFLNRHHELLKHFNSGSSSSDSIGFILVSQIHSIEEAK